MSSLCCKRCCDILQWKVDFGKYEPLELPRKCNSCREKSVVIAYHHICQPCALERAVCAKCQKKPSFDDGSTNAGGGDPEGTPEEARSVGSDDTHSAAVTGKPHVLARFTFVNDIDSDEEFHRLRGLDVRRLKSHKKRLAMMEQKDVTDGLRERERRSVLRQTRKAGAAKRSPLGEEDVLSDSDDEL
jgi:hypothetical protein